MQGRALPDARVVENAAWAIREKGLDAEEGQIRIRTLGDGGEASVTIIDNGVGLTAEGHRYMFEPFAGTREDRPGIGLANHATHGPQVRRTNRRRLAARRRHGPPHPPAGDVRVTAGHGRRPVLSVLLAPMFLTAAAGAYFAFGGAVGSAASDAPERLFPCATQDLARAAFIADLRKPLDPTHAALPGALLRQAAAEVNPDTELAVYALSAHAEVPRTLLGRLRKTVDLVGLAAPTAKHRAADDCDLPAQAPATARASAIGFCRERDALARRIEALAVETLGQRARPRLSRGGAGGNRAGVRENAGHAVTVLGSGPARTMVLTRGDAGPGVGVRADGGGMGRVAAGGTVARRSGRNDGAHPLRAARGDDRRGERANRAQAVLAKLLRGRRHRVRRSARHAGMRTPSLTEAPTTMELAAYELERLRHSGALVERERTELARERAELARERARLVAERPELAEARERLDARARDLDVPAAGRRGRGPACRRRRRTRRRHLNGARVRFEVHPGPPVPRATRVTQAR